MTELIFRIAIDGPAGSGKSTIAKKLSDILNISYLDTGAMFRCVTLFFIQRDVDLNNVVEVSNRLKEIDIRIEGNQAFLNGKDVSKDIRSQKVSDLVSKVSTIPEVRKKLKELQINIAKGQSIIMDGRDIGTVIIPDAELKIYLEATAEERARRRMNQYQDGTTFEEALENIKKRDYIDSTRQVAPLKKAEDAIVIDTTHLTEDEVVEKIVNLIKGR